MLKMLWDILKLDVVLRPVEDDDRYQRREELKEVTERASNLSERASKAIGRALDAAGMASVAAERASDRWEDLGDSCCASERTGRASEQAGSALHFM